jgi:crotonobetainyl-CoA:carnitine CoA-transferase CaiB-like acyl-CoA transferase
MDPHSRSAFEQLMARIGLSESDTGGQVSFTGADPVLPSRLRYGAATASALAAQGAAIATIWKMRSGRGQNVSVDLARAVHLGLRTVQNMRQNGREFGVGSLTRCHQLLSHKRRAPHLPAAQHRARQHHDRPGRLSQMRQQQ